ncbi:hypothetical protein OSB04_009813 [Centaurea solstitialis]|uniref:RRM domain-containing protein n=1 Tax=Centaurea solstitialis TaxID=347529 RepID=A0AA38WMH7_9ASTR|nr:hypothetical protein OSB04_009813 [Centaurea solstitialis]
MGKKPKESHPQIPNPSSSGSIFKSLFGGALEEEPNNDPASVSIFSDSNPFRTKPTNQSIPEQLQQVLRLDIDSPIKNEVVNKRKRKEKLDSIDSDSDIEGEVEVKKSKVESGFLVSEETSKKKKKRKRDEVEAEYEERKYGAMDVDLKEGEEEGVNKGGGRIGEKRKELDKGEELLVPSKEGFDDEEKLLRTVFVGNLPLKVKKKALVKEFSQFGDVESVRIRSIPLLDDKTPRKGAIIKKKINDAVDRVNAYVVFKTEDSAQASCPIIWQFYSFVLDLHKTISSLVGGNHIHVDRAIPPRKKLKGENIPLYDSKRTVFIGNLPFDVKDEELYQLFTGFNNLKDSIEAIRVVRDPGTAWERELLMSCLRQGPHLLSLNIKEYLGILHMLLQEAANTVVRKHKLKIRDRELRLSHAMKANLPPSKHKESLYDSSKKPTAGGSTSSYQGIRATKSGGQKKFATRFARPERSESRSEHSVKRKVRSDKRPSVAARKAAANAARTGGDGGGSSGGTKRKPESRTPQSNSRQKKARKFR